MQIERIKPVAFMAVFLFLLGVSAASATGREERLFSKQPGKSPRMLHVGKRQGKGPGDLQHFLKSLGSIDCESNCCWAYADCDGGGEVYCEDSVGCSASCYGTTVSYSCKAT
jgi:hypothetical protein